MVRSCYELFDDCSYSMIHARPSTTANVTHCAEYEGLAHAFREKKAWLRCGTVPVLARFVTRRPTLCTADAERV